MEFWSEKYNQIPTYTVRRAIGRISERAALSTSSVSHRSPAFLETLPLPSKKPLLAARRAPAWSPNSLPRLPHSKITGGARKDQHSRRATASSNRVNEVATSWRSTSRQPPYGLSYTRQSGARPSLAQPYVAAGNGTFLGNPYPFAFSLLNARQPVIPIPVSSSGHSFRKTQP